MVDLINLLAERHKDDVFVTECNTGSALYGCRRMDAWAMRKSWAPWTTIGYEIKVARSDFLRDSKFVDYLPCCHELYFVCPANLIAVEELPPMVGLLWASVNNKRLYTKRKAVRRDPDYYKISQLLTYIVMARAVIVKSVDRAAVDVNSGLNKLEARRKLVEQAEACGILAAFVRGHIRKQWDLVENQRYKNAEAEGRTERFVNNLKKHGIDYNTDKGFQYAAQSQISKLLGAVDDGLLVSMEATANRLNDLIKDLKNCNPVKEP